MNFSKKISDIASPLLGTAWFRGVPFKVDTAEHHSGRRAVVHEYPKRSLPYAQDLGRKARELQIDGWVIGDQQWIARQALIDACERVGVGQLIHPSIGVLSVVCTGFIVHDDNRESHITRFTLNVKEAGHWRYPTSAVNQKSTLGPIVEAGVAIAASDFLHHVTLHQQPDVVRQDATNLIQHIGHTLQTQATPITQGTTTEQATYQQHIHALINQADALLDDLNALIQKLQQVLAEAIQYLPALNAFKLYQHFMQFGEDSVDHTALSPARMTVQHNRRCFYQWIHVSALIYAVKHFATLSFETREAAKQAQQHIIDQIYQQQQQASDERFNYLQQLRVVFIANLPDVNQLPQLIPHRLTKSMPALQVVYQLYGDLKKLDELIARNRIKNPLLITANQTISVLSQ